MLEHQHYPIQAPSIEDQAEVNPRQDQIKVDNIDIPKIVTSQSPIKMNTPSSSRKRLITNGSININGNQGLKKSIEDIGKSKFSMRSTDFGSKGMYKPTTVIGGKTTNLWEWVEKYESKAEQWRTSLDNIKFKETANLKLSGTTFDSCHMNQFMRDCPFVVRPTPSNFIKKGQDMQSPEITNSKIRMSGCFSSIDRYNKG